jgi:hypothetical protein
MLIRFVGHYMSIIPRQIVEKIAFFFFYHLNFVSRFLLFIFNVLLQYRFDPRSFIEG